MLAVLRGELIEPIPKVTLPLGLAARDGRRLVLVGEAAWRLGDNDDLCVQY